MDEFDIIATYFRPLAKADGAFGLIDDVAELDIDGDEPIIVTTDALVEGVHFLPSGHLNDVGFKLAAVNVSDCLAKGALPRAASLVLAIPEGRPDLDIGAFAAGLAEAFELWHCALLGGDTVATTGPLLVALTMHGQCIGGNGPVRRSGASIGDDVWVSGSIGDAYLGLQAARGALPETACGADEVSWIEHLRSRYARPSLPPLKLAGVISAHASASIDVSDGLLADADKLAKASGVGISVEASALPFSDSVRRWRDLQTSDEVALSQLVSGGDDYQLLFTTSAEVRPEVMGAAPRFGLSRIGTCVSGDRAGLYCDGGEVIPRGLGPRGLGWRHCWPLA